MPKPSRKRHDEPKLDLDEILADPSMNGLVSFLNPPPPGWEENRAVRTERNLANLRRMGIMVPEPAKPPTVGASEMPMVCASHLPTVDRLQMPMVGDTVDPILCKRVTSESTTEQSTVGISDLTMVAIVDLPTVGGSELPTVGTFPDGGWQQGDERANPPTVGKSIDPSAELKTEPPTVGTSNLPTVGIVNSPTVNGYGFFSDIEERQLFDARFVCRIGRVQDVMSKAEFGYYMQLWNLTGPGITVLEKDEHVKVFQAGYMTIARSLGMDKRTVARMLDGLALKQAVEVQQTGGSIPSGRFCGTYRVYSFREILNRLKAAGYEYAKKLGKAVVPVKPFVKFGPPVTIGNLNLPTIDISKLPTVGGSNLPTVGTSANAYGGETAYGRQMPTVTVGKLESDSLLGFIDVKYNDDDVVAIERRLAETEFRSFDRAAIHQIWKQSREAVSDVTPDEVCQIFLEKAKPLLCNRRVENLNGLILHMWKSWLTPSRVMQLRGDRRLESEFTAQDERTDTFRRTISDPEASEEEKRVAMAALGLKTT
jgi:hypothetical protein